MSKKELVKNAAGRFIPKMVNGTKQVPFKGVNAFLPRGNKAQTPIPTCTQYPFNGDKTVGSLKEALVMCGLKSNMTISSHHHFRNGDLVMNQVFDIAATQGVKGLRWFPSAAFPCHEPVIKHIENGVVVWVEG